MPPAVSDARIAGGAAALVRPNIKLVLSGQLETASGTQRCDNGEAQACYEAAELLFIGTSGDNAGTPVAAQAASNGDSKP